jgi:vanillate O-demethylase ferredoxin subunit
VKNSPAWIDAKLRATRDVTPDIRLFELEPTDILPPASPGSHINVQVWLGDQPDVRSYSLVGLPEAGILRIAVKHLPLGRGGSAHMWRLATGATLRISAPRNFFALSRHDSDYLLVAGGIGITPILGMAQFLAASGARLRVLYACRTPKDAAFADILQHTLGDRLFMKLDSRQERVQFADEIDRLADGGELYVCGPIGMLEAAKAAWRASGRPPERLRFETFGSSGHAASQSFQVSIPRLGRELSVSAGQTMLDAMQLAGIEMMYDCKRGECGLCALRILSVEGVVDHRDVFLSEAEKAANTKLCTCVSRVAGGRITIDTADREV